jgi:hypothetical protein
MVASGIWNVIKIKAALGGAPPSFVSYHGLRSDHPATAAGAKSGFI